MTRARVAPVVALALLVLIGSCGGDSERVLVGRVEMWTTEDTILSVVRNHDPLNLGGPTFPDEVEEFVALSSVASFWPIELPDGLVLRGARLTLVEGEPAKLQAAFIDPDAGLTAEVVWEVVDGEIGALTRAGPDTLSNRDGVLTWRWASFGLERRIVEAMGCGHSLLAMFPIDTYTNVEIQRAVGRQFIDCR